MSEDITPVRAMGDGVWDVLCPFCDSWWAYGSSRPEVTTTAILAWSDVERICPDCQDELEHRPRGPGGRRH
jgi:hypothetical protein